MKPAFRKILLRRLTDALEPFKGTHPVPPGGGWLRSIRLALGMPARYPARKLRFTTQAFESLEKSEAAEAITLKTLRKAANAIDCELVYALVPKSGSLDAMIKQQAKKRARKTMAPVAHTMLLESQGTHTSENRINEIAEQLADSPKPSLWQD